jgi:hypothetical protein
VHSAQKRLRAIHFAHPQPTIENSSVCWIVLALMYRRHVLAVCGEHLSWASIEDDKKLNEMHDMLYFAYSCLGNEQVDLAVGNRPLPHFPFRNELEPRSGVVQNECRLRLNPSIHLEPYSVVSILQTRR